jgi:ribonuclease III
MSDQALELLQEILGYTFTNHDLLVQALTHSSRKNELNRSNERLEFLGDSILGVVISEHLFHQFEDHTEGDLTRIKSAVVSRASLARVAKEMDLGKYLLVAKGVARVPHGAEDNGELPTETGQKKKLPSSLISNALEAIIAAVYLDGGPEKAREFILRHMDGQIDRAIEHAHAHNFKSALQQYCQRKWGVSPEYLVISEEGPDHVKLFEIVTLIDGKEYGRGRGTTKKAAEQQAAETALKELGAENWTPENGNGEEAD